MAYYSLYLVTAGEVSNYFVTEPATNFPNYFVTVNSVSRYFVSQDKLLNSRYVVSSGTYGRYIVSEDKLLNSRYFTTLATITRYFTTELRGIDEYENICHYPKELDIIRQKATLLYWDILKSDLYSSIDKEAYGRKDTKGYFSAGNLRLLLDYLSSVWLEKDTDSRSGLVRTSDYYYTTYSINDLILNYRKCDLNIKPIVALFNLNSYSIIDGNWPNYFLINNILYPPTEDTLKTLKQYTDIFSLESISLDANQSKYNIADAQTNFPLTKELKYLSSFSINGSDYIAYTDYNRTSITYSPSVLFGYTISSSDTVTITYWYEE